MFFWLKYWILRWQFEVCCCVVQRLCLNCNDVSDGKSANLDFHILKYFSDPHDIMFSHVLQSIMLFTSSQWLQQVLTHPEGPGIKALDFTLFHCHWPWLGPYKLFISLCKNTLNKLNLSGSLSLNTHLSHRIHITNTFVALRYYSTSIIIHKLSRSKIHKKCQVIEHGKMTCFWQKFHDF